MKAKLLFGHKAVILSIRCWQCLIKKNNKTPPPPPPRANSVCFRYAECWHRLWLSCTMCCTKILCDMLMYGWILFWLLAMMGCWLGFDFCLFFLQSSDHSWEGRRWGPWRPNIDRDVAAEFLLLTFALLFAIGQIIFASLGDISPDSTNLGNSVKWKNSL